ncbi:hypothetical protein BBP40_005420 [Aspergillus hancockii]|nr:hypothetical protein BBP40_005420 [Aspergillus hancockii]
MSRLISHTIKETLKRAINPDRSTVEVEKNAEDDWSARIAERARWFAAFPSTPGYLTGEGLVQEQYKLSETMQQIAIRFKWGEGILSFHEIVEAWMDGRKLSGLTVDS